jgi:hypothetical protein|tara:strand:+ start:238 stop:573 length:336 start_codon:yes stop_codon:yes gene_type:complete
MANSKLGNAMIAMMIKQNQSKWGDPKQLRKINQLGQYAASSVSSKNDNFFAKELAASAPKKTLTTKAIPVPESKKAQRTGAKIMNNTSKRQGRVKRPKASSIPISKENQLG